MVQIQTIKTLTFLVKLIQAQSLIIHKTLQKMKKNQVQVIKITLMTTMTFLILIPN
ncbi:Uncharacterised protein [Chlamydia trachomatis]|nr:Uncharacterised protein [Chlamydia trachomatis]